MPHKDPVARADYRKEYVARNKAKKAAYDREYVRTPERRAKKKAYDLVYCQEHRAEKNAYSLQWYKDHPEQVRNTRLKRCFNITTEIWDAKFAAQNFRCALCNTADAGKHGWHTDHDHSCCPGVNSCGKCIRAILCGTHNKGLGHFQDSSEMLRAAADYIERWRALHGAESVIP
jgi:hypothetical protein